MKTQRTTAAFTMIEAMIALFIFSLVIAGTMAFFRGVMIRAKGGSSQMQYLAMAENVQQRIAGYVHEGKAVGLETNTVTIWLTHNQMARIEYIDGDHNPTTTTDNVLRYDPNIWVSGDERVLCRFVRPVDGCTNLFAILPNSPAAVRFEFHLGDSVDANDASSRQSGPGYQGVDVVFSAAPRDLQYWYQ